MCLRRDTSTCHRQPQKDACEEMLRAWWYVDDILQSIEQKGDLRSVIKIAKYYTQRGQLDRTRFSMIARITSI